MSTPNQPILMLAEYLTGPEVAHHSISLGVPAGPLKMRERAERFFALRSAFGVEGYDSPATAEVKITRAIESESAKLKALLEEAVEELDAMAYKPGKHPFEHIHYCRWCHFAESTYPHSETCLLQRLKAVHSVPVSEQEPVAWRWKEREYLEWDYSENAPVGLIHEAIIEPLYGHPWKAVHSEGK